MLHLVHLQPGLDSSAAHSLLGVKRRLHIAVRIPESTRLRDGIWEPVRSEFSQQQRQERHVGGIGERFVGH